MKIAQDPKNQFDGGKTGTEWRSKTRGYLMGCLPITKDLLDWAERPGKTPLIAEAVPSLAPHMEEDPMVVNHLLWAFFQSARPRKYFRTWASSRA